MVIRFLLTNCWSAWKNLKADSIAYKLSVVWWDLPLRRRIKTADSFGTIEPFNDLFAGAACPLFVCWVCVNDPFAGAACPLSVCWVCVNDPLQGRHVRCLYVGCAIMIPLQGRPLWPSGRSSDRINVFICLFEASGLRQQLIGYQCVAPIRRRDWVYPRPTSVGQE